MVLLIDNYDSFSYNLVQLIGSIKEDIKVIRNDEMSVDEIITLAPSHIVLSPGPGKPKDAGVCEEVVEKIQGKIPILGVCLGHQSICEAYGATVTYAKRLFHGKQSMITTTNKSVLWEGLPEEFMVARYHSLAAKEDTIPSNLKITAMTEDGEVMAVEDAQKKVYGLQFHPESIMTPLGREMMINFLQEEIR